MREWIEMSSLGDNADEMNRVKSFKLTTEARR
jgi:hypothetical protein